MIESSEDGWRKVRKNRGWASSTAEPNSERATHYFRPSWSPEAEQSWREAPVDRTGQSQPLADTSVIFDSTGLHARERFEAFRAFWSGMYNVAALDFPVDDFSGVVRLWNLGPVTMGQLRLPPVKSHRPARCAQGFEQDVLVLRIVTSGILRIALDGQIVELAPGTAYLCDEMKPSAYINGPQFAFTTFVIPYDAIGYDPYRHPSLTAIPLDTPEGRLLLAIVDALYREVARPGEFNGDKLSRPLIGFLRALAFDPDDDLPAGPLVEEFRAAAMRRYLDEHLLDQKLDADTIGRAIGASRASVYRTFESEGGVRRAIRMRRLRAALMDLVESGMVRCAVGEAAARWGMYDANRFSRMCREEFGYSPSACSTS